MTHLLGPQLPLFPSRQKVQEELASSLQVRPADPPPARFQAAGSLCGFSGSCSPDRQHAAGLVHTTQLCTASFRHAYHLDLEMLGGL